MQTEQQRKKDNDGTTLPRQNRPRQFDAGIRVQGEATGGPQAEGWGQHAYPTYQPFASGQGFAPYQSGQQPGFGAEQQTPVGQFGQYGPGQGIGFGGTSFGMPFANPWASLAPTLSYGLAGLADLVYRGVALATTQGQALINTVRPMPGGIGAGRQPPVAWPSARLPATDIVDEGAEIVCQVELPGVKPENVEVSCFGRGLLVSAHAQSEIDLGALVQAERGLEPTYRRAINLPVPVQPSGAKATLRDGILTVNLPKANPTEAPRRIPVS
jgi:HSP20 family molecular chaperone IbpA